MKLGACKIGDLYRSWMLIEVGGSGARTAGGPRPKQHAPRVRLPAVRRRLPLVAILVLRALVVPSAVPMLALARVLLGLVWGVSLTLALVLRLAVVVAGVDVGWTVRLVGLPRRPRLWSLGFPPCPWTSLAWPGFARGFNGPGPPSPPLKI